MQMHDINIGFDYFQRIREPLDVPVAVSMAGKDGDCGSVRSLSLMSFILHSVQTVASSATNGRRSDAPSNHLRAEFDFCRGGSPLTSCRLSDFISRPTASEFL